jgi:hypothetical protein
MNHDYIEALVNLPAYVRRIEEQRDELLRALKDAYPYVNDDALRVRIGALIAKVAGV